MGVRHSDVVVPLDGSSLANEAFPQALETFDTRIAFLSVVTPMAIEMSEGGCRNPATTP